MFQIDAGGLFASGVDKGQALTRLVLEPGVVVPDELVAPGIVHEHKHSAPVWIKTIPGKGWWSTLRIYGPQAPAFDGTWKLNDIVEVK